MPVLLAVRATVVGIPLAVLLVAGCGSSGSPGAGGSHDAITLYSGQHEQTTDKLVAGFEKATGITVNVRNDDEDVLDDQIQTEGSHSPADVFFTENTMPLQDLASHGLLAPIKPSTLAQTPAKYNSPQGDWVGVSARVSVLDYNPSKISGEPAPDDRARAGRPEVQGQAGHRARGERLPADRHLDAADYGKARTLRWLDGLKANAGDTHTYPDNETIADQVNRGQVAFGLINQYYWYRLGAQIGTSNDHSEIAYFAPNDPGYVLNVSGAGILASSDHQAAAQKFVAYLTSTAGQQIIAHSISFEYPIASGVTTSQPRDAARPAAAQPDRPRPARRRPRGDRAAAPGAAAVTTVGSYLPGSTERPAPVGSPVADASPPLRAAAGARGGERADRRGHGAAAVFLLVLAHQAGGGEVWNLDHPPPHRGPALEHRAALGRRHGALRGDRDRGGVVRRAHEPAAAPDVGGAGRRYRSRSRTSS